MKNALEIVIFKVNPATDVAEFMKVSADMEEGFAKKQKGFVSRTFARNGNDEWVDVIRWESMADAENASKAALQSPACAPMFGMIDEASVKMMHFDIFG